MNRPVAMNIVLGAIILVSALAAKLIHREFRQGDGLGPSLEFRRDQPTPHSAGRDIDA